MEYNHRRDASEHSQQRRVDCDTEDNSSDTDGNHNDGDNPATQACFDHQDTSSSTSVSRCIPAVIRADGGHDEETESMPGENKSEDQNETVDETETVKSIGIVEAQECAKAAAEELFEHDFKSVIEVEAEDNNEWRTVIELVERRAVPDTQDIIGRYQLKLTSTGDVAGYELLERYQRGDMKEEL